MKHPDWLAVSMRWNDVLAKFSTQSLTKSRSVAGSVSTQLPRPPGFLHRDVIDRPFESQSNWQPAIHQPFT
jgi:hypothetical protein